MKKLSDYKGEEAIDLWANMLDPLSRILSDKSIAQSVKSGKPKAVIAKDILKSHKDEAVEILQCIDDTPLDGINLVLRLISLINELGENEEIKAFFGFAEQVKTNNVSSGLPMENTGAKEK